MTDNPFFESWGTPFDLPPFDRIRPEHFPSAFDRAMAEHIGEIEAIASASQVPSFSNVIEALERSGRLLDRVSKTFFNLTASNTNDALDAIERDYAPKLAQHRMRIALNGALFDRLRDLFDKRERLGLDEDQKRLLERRHLDFVRAGAALETEAKNRLSDISERLATLHTDFSQNVLKDEKDWRMVLGEGDLDGLPDDLRAAAAEAARERGEEGKWVITLSRSSIEPFLTFSTRRDLRQTAYQAWTRRGAHAGEKDNRPLITEIVALRQEQARLLGYGSYAAYRLDDTMAKTVGAVEALLYRVWEPAKRKAAAECADLEALARQEGANAKIEAWDWRYYAEKVRKSRYDLDEAEIKPYFVLDNMVAAAFDTARRLFGLTFTERQDIRLYHPDAKAYEVRDETGAKVGLFLHDNFARMGKQSGAWMSCYRDQENLDGPVLPIVVNNNNFAKASPTLLTFDDAETLFHEFGHGLHGLLSKVRYPSQSGTEVRRDFVEFPSQVFEHWMSVPENFRQFARHYKTNEPMPEALLQRLIAARTFNQGFATVEYTASALLDLAMHKDAQADLGDVDGFENKVLAALDMPAAIGARHRPAHFGHLFSGDGYAAGYYAYLWAEVLDADGFAAFQDKGDVFDPILAAKLKSIYSAGDTKDPMDLYIGLRGRPPKVEPLLEQRGLVGTEA